MDGQPGVGPTWKGLFGKTESFTDGSTARVDEDYLRGFAESARSLTAPGVVALLVSLLLTMWSIESTFNRVWRVPTPRSGLLRFLIYWTLLTLGTLINPVYATEKTTAAQQWTLNMKDAELPRLDETLSALATAAAGR